MAMTWHCRLYNEIGLRVVSALLKVSGLVSAAGLQLLAIAALNAPEPQPISNQFWIVNRRIMPL
jgi:hypothetical protein